MKKINKSDILFYVLLLGYTVFFLFITGPFNLGVSADSVSYLDIANNVFYHNSILRNGKLITTHWPPGYPVLLGLFSKLCGYEPLVCGRYFNAILLFFTGVVFRLILKKITSDLYIQNIFPFLLLLSVPFFRISLRFWSELPFIFILLVIFYLLIDWSRNRNVKILVVAGLLSGILFLIRYAGVGLVGGMLIWLYLVDHRRWKNIIIFILSMLPVFVFWKLTLWQFSGKTFERPFAVHWVPLYRIAKGGYNAIFWFITRYSLPVYAIVFLILLIGFLRKTTFLSSSIKDTINNHRQILLLNIIIPIVYFLFLLTSISFFDFYTPLDYRILSPIYPSLLIIIALILLNFLSNWKRFFIGAFTIITAINVYPYAKIHYQKGMGFNAKMYVYDIKRQIDMFIRNHNLTIYSNAADLISFNYKRKAKFLLNKNNANWKNDWKKIKNEILEGQSIIIYFKQIHRSHFISKDTILSSFPQKNVMEKENVFLIYNPEKIQIK